jgi:hypothetical protein
MILATERPAERLKLQVRDRIAWVDAGGTPRAGEVRSFDDGQILVQWDGGAQKPILWSAADLRVVESVSPPDGAGPERKHAPLSGSESARRKELETAVRQGLGVAGAALREIRDNRLYRDTHFTFEEYCQAEFGLSRRHADRQIAVTKVLDDLRPLGLTGPANEAQARALAPVPPEQRQDVWREAVDSAPAGKVTAAHVEETARRVLSPPPPTPEQVRKTEEWEARKQEAGAGPTPCPRCGLPFVDTANPGVSVGIDAGGRVLSVHVGCQTEAEASRWPRGQAQATIHADPDCSPATPATLRELAEVVAESLPEPPITHCARCNAESTSGRDQLKAGGWVANAGLLVCPDCLAQEARWLERVEEIAAALDRLLPDDYPQAARGLIQEGLCVESEWALAEGGEAVLLGVLAAGGRA